MEKNNTLQRRQTRMTHMQVGEVNGMVPPQAVELEKSVLGALMLDQEALFGHIYDMHEGLFYKTEHQIIFSAIRMLQNCKYDVDMLTVVEELRREGNLEAAGGAFYVSQLTANVVSAAHMDYHLQILTEKYMQREVIRTATESIKMAYDETCDPIQLLDDAQKSLMEVSEKSFSRESQSMDAFMSNAEKTFLSEKPEDDRSVLSGFVELDRRIAGFQPGTLIILAARPAMGKTACGLTMAKNIAINFHKPVAYFSLEMTGDELVSRLLSAEAEIPASKLRKSANLNKFEKDRLADKILALRKAPLYIDDSAGIDIFQMRAKCRRLKQRYDIKMVFIDYLQLMNGTPDANRNRNREQEISNISRQLKEMSKELEIPVLAMSQLSRKVEDRPMAIPQLADLRESGAIEQDADIVMAIHRPEKYGLEQDEMGNSTANLANIHILKFRSGDTGVCPLMFEGKFVRFRDFPVIGEPMIRDSKMNAEIKQNDDFDNPAKELHVDNDGNPIFLNGGLPPIEDTTPPSIIPTEKGTMTNNQMPSNDDLFFA
ncbi:MAG: replicative DNA helicase [Bacteroidales bacterium]|nr:replicative DNA helicase [Bacteroidales bacterium]